MTDLPDPPKPGWQTAALGRVSAGRLLTLVVLVGWGCRLAQFFAGASYWHDEALVVMNVMDKTAPQLVGKLDYAQAVPPLFLLAERGLFRVFGAGEYSLRLVSLLSGLCSVWLFARLCRNTLSTSIAPWIAALFALSDKLIWHSAEVKPYSGDAYCAVLLLFIALPRRGDATSKLNTTRMAVNRMLLLSVAATVLVWFSFPAAIVYGGLSLMLLPSFWREGLRGRLIYILLNSAVACSFLLLYHFSIRPQHVDYLSTFWANDFPPYAHPGRIPFWLVGEIYALCDHPYRSFGPLILLLAIWGAVIWRRAGRFDVLAACLLPIGMAVVAACLKQYPFNGDRVTIYLVPGLFLLCGGAVLPVAGATRLSAKRLQTIAIALMFIIIGRAAGEAAYRLIVPRNSSSARVVTQFVRAHRQPGQGLYLVGEPEPVKPTYRSQLNLEILCYWHHPPQPLHLGMPADLSQIAEEKFWLVFGSVPKLRTNAATPLLKQLAPFAIEEARFVPRDRNGMAILMRRTVDSVPATK